MSIRFFRGGDKGDGCIDLSGGQDPLCRSLNVGSCFTFPDPEHNPAGSCHGFVGRSITSLVHRDLGTPLNRVRTPKLLRAVLWAVVPVAPINEHRQPITRQHQIRRETANPAIKAEPQPKRMHCATQLDLGLRIACDTTPQVSADVRGHPAGSIHGRR